MSRDFARRYSPPVRGADLRRLREEARVSVEELARCYSQGHTSCERIRAIEASALTSKIVESCYVGALRAVVIMRKLRGPKASAQERF